jgi:hypothetical protein
MSAFFCASFAASLVLLAVTAQGVVSNGIGRRAAVCFLAYAINACLSAAALSMPAVGPGSTLGRTGAAALFAIGTCAVLLAGPFQSLLMLNKYVLASRATAVRLSGNSHNGAVTQHDVAQSHNESATMAVCTGIWAIYSVVCAVADISNTSVAVGFSSMSTRVSAR